MNDRPACRLSAVFAFFMGLACAAGDTPPAGQADTNAGTVFRARFESISMADFAAGSPAMESVGASLVPGRTGRGVELGPNGRVEIGSAGNLPSAQGTLSFWFKPNWSSSTGGPSHTLLSWGWDDGKQGYAVLSDGWWEPAGAGHTYLVFENQFWVQGRSPLEYEKGVWRHYTIAWSHGRQMSARLYVDGELAIHALRPCDAAAPTPRTPLFLGSDGGTPQAKGRFADGVFDDLVILDRRLDREQVRAAYRAADPDWLAAERRRNAWLYDVLQAPYAPKRDPAGRILESRALLDEGLSWITRAGAAAVLDRMVRAGFNVYIPCIWHGRGARWPGSSTAMEVAAEKLLRDEPPGFDPLDHLLREAHARGIEVHPWFCVCSADANWKPLAPFVEEGAPRGAGEVHNPAFRKFAVDLMTETVRRYAVDGINLDYIRAKGISTSATARASYRQRFGRELLDDLKTPETNGWPNARVVQWQDEAVGGIVRDFATRARALRPTLVISSDGRPYPPAERTQTEGRNDFWWAQEGWVDVIYSMDYARVPSYRRTDAVRAALNRPAAAAIIVGNYEQTDAGAVVSREGRLVADLIGFCQRRYPGNGVALYWYGSLDDEQIESLRSGPFREPARPFWVRAAK